MKKIFPFYQQAQISNQKTQKMHTKKGICLSENGKLYR